MRAPHTAEQVLRLAASQNYVCRSCRLRAVRQFSTSPSRPAELPFFKRIQKTLFGSKEAEQATRDREEKQAQRYQEAATRQDAGFDLEIIQDTKGNEYKVAAIVDPSINKQYVQATRWDGLESVGSVQWVKERADKGEVYHGFLPAKRVELSNRQWQRLLRHMLVELLTLQNAGRSLEEICHPRTEGNNWAHTQNTTITISEDGAATLQFADVQAEQAILQAIPESASSEQRTDRQADSEAIMEEVMDIVAEGRFAGNGGDRSLLPPSWMDVSLKDPQLKIAIIKRTLQLTGKRVPDPSISTSSTLADLYNAYKVKEKPKKLAQTPQMQKLKADVPNVSVYPRRQTLIDREQQVGRWKVIEEELNRRDLPVTGTRWRGANVRSY